MIDTHHHLWHYNPHEYGWIDDRMSLLKSDHLAGTLTRLMDETGVSASVVVQARQSLAETEWLLQVSEHHPAIAGVVGWVDLCSAAIDEQLSRYAANPKLKGVRHVVHDEPDDRFMARPDFRLGISKLQLYNLCYDLLLYPRHLELAAVLCSRFPDQRFILDHLGKPPIREGAAEPWKRDLKKLAANPNVACKLSGMVTEANWISWKREDLLPYLDIAWELFGADRLMVGSDWPVCTLAGDYPTVMSVIPWYLDLRGVSASEKEKVLSSNAERWYLLNIR